MPSALPFFLLWGDLTAGADRQGDVCERRLTADAASLGAPKSRGEEEQRSECHFAKAKSNDAQLVTTKSQRSKKSRNSAECPKIFRAPQEDAGPYGEDGNWIKPYREGAETLPYERTCGNAARVAPTGDQSGGRERVRQ